MTSDPAERLLEFHRLTSVGYWSVENGQHVYVKDPTSDESPTYLGMMDGFSEAEAEFFVAAHNELPNLIDTLRYEGERKMGWGSAGSIFDPTVQALIDSGASDEVITKVATNLISNLRENDWDTYDESLEAFKDHPAVVKAFADLDIHLHHRNYEPMSPDDLHEIRDLRSRTTDLQWTIDTRTKTLDGVFLTQDGSFDSCQGTLVSADLATNYDLMFIATAHRYVPKLLDEIQRLKAKLRQEYSDRDE